MAANQDIHTIIEEQDLENKRKSMLNLQEKLASEGIDITPTNKSETRKPRGFNRRNFVIASVAFVLLLSGILIPLLLTDFDDGVRYCTSEDYYTIETDQSISDYAIANKKSMLCLKWENGAERIWGQQYLLNDSNDVIGLYEDGINSEGLITYFYVISNKFELDLLDKYKSMCIGKSIIDNTEVMHNIDTASAYAMFKYKDYCYYLQIDDSPEPDYILTVIQTLLAEYENNVR